MRPLLRLLAHHATQDRVLCEVKRAFRKKDCSPHPTGGAARTGADRTHGADRWPGEGPAAGRVGRLGETRVVHLPKAVTYESLESGLTASEAMPSGQCAGAPRDAVITIATATDWCLSGGMSSFISLITPGVKRG